jgi:hypothetical protein
MAPQEALAAIVERFGFLVAEFGFAEPVVASEDGRLSVGYARGGTRVLVRWGGDALPEVVLAFRRRHGDGTWAATLDDLAGCRPSGNGAGEARQGPAAREALNAHLSERAGLLRRELRQLIR